VTLKKTTDDPVTVNVERDAGSIADTIQSLVDAANALREAINLSTKYDPETRKSSPLTGNSTVRRLASAINRAIADAVPWANPSTPGLAGISYSGTGELTFTRATFLAEFAEDPDGMEDAFTQFGSATSNDVSFVSAGDRARAGTYDVVITQAATQASDIGLEGSWPLGLSQTVKVRVGSTEATYTIQATDTQQDAVDGINAAIADAGLDLAASISGTGIQVRSNTYGSNAQFSVAWDGATYEAFAGLNVEGTIDGVTGTGSGRTLSIPFDDTQLGGLTLTISATAPGALGSVTYNQGLAQRVNSSILDATDVITGYITSTEKTLKSRIEFINNQVESMERRVTLFEARLRKQYATLDSTLGVLQQQSNWLAGQIAGLMQ
jgi:flagellar hook-associated protein 2